mmetsp:Transcript_32415/g.47780  ORF Transcript_32415/g.47780 Transcript_32415/m.47780 type:complete len:453 (+) Transcript_32415:2-1360(+)
MASVRTSLLPSSIQSTASQTFHTLYQGHIMAEVDIIAPSGALGLVLGTIGPEGGPIVKDVKPESQLLGKVQAGDKIVAIDDVDVQTSKHSHVIQLLRNNSTSDERKITILRESQAQTTERWSSISRRTLAGFVGAAKSPRSRSTEPGSHEPDESGHPTTKQEISCHNTIDDDGDVNDCTNQLSNGLHLDHIPTLPRFPVLETKDRNCWSEPSHTIFKIRGCNYLVDPKNKIQSGPYLFTARGADLILTNDKSGPRTGIAEKYSSILAGHARSIPTFVINFIFDWGILVNYYEIPAMYVSFLRARYEGSNQDLPAMDALQPHERAIIRFLVGSDNHRNATLKLIPKCPEGPWAVRQLVNGKPALIGKRLPAQYSYYPAEDGKAECFEADLDTRETDRVGKKAISLCRKYMTTVTLDVGIVIEGTNTSELPEQMLGCVRIHRLDPKMSPTLPSL